MAITTVRNGDLTLPKDNAASPWYGASPAPTGNTPGATEDVVIAHACTLPTGAAVSYKTLDGTGTITTTGTVSITLASGCTYTGAKDCIICNIDDYTGFIVPDKAGHLTINGNLTTASKDGLDVSAGTVTVNGIVTSTTFCIYTTGGTVNVVVASGKALVTTGAGMTAQADAGTINVTGDCEGGTNCISAADGDINVTGNVYTTASSGLTIPISLTGEGNIVVNGLSWGYTDCIVSQIDATGSVTVNGDLFCLYDDCVNLYGAATITVNGNVFGHVLLRDTATGGHVTIHGNIAGVVIYAVTCLAGRCDVYGVPVGMDGDHNEKPTSNHSVNCVSPGEVHIHLPTSYPATNITGGGDAIVHRSGGGGLLTVGL